MKLPFGYKPICYICKVTSSVKWSKNEEKQIICNTCSTRPHASQARRPCHFNFRKSTRAKSTRKNAKTPISTKGTGRKCTSKNPAPKKLQKMYPAVKTVSICRFKGRYLQIGDIVSVANTGRKSYFAQVHGLVMTESGAKAAYITWLIPSSESAKYYFHPRTYALGAKDNVPRNIDSFDFVCRLPENYYKDDTTPYKLLTPGSEKGFIWATGGEPVMRVPIAPPKRKKIIKKKKNDNEIEKETEKVREQGTEKGTEKLNEKSAEKVKEKGTEKMKEKVKEKGKEKVKEKGKEKGKEKSKEKGFDKVKEKGLDKVKEKGLDKVKEKEVPSSSPSTSTSSNVHQPETLMGDHSSSVTRSRRSIKYRPSYLNVPSTGFSFPAVTRVRRRSTSSNKHSRPVKPVTKTRRSTVTAPRHPPGTVVRINNPKDASKGYTIHYADNTRNANIPSSTKDCHASTVVHVHKTVNLPNKQLPSTHIHYPSTLTGSHSQDLPTSVYYSSTSLMTYTVINVNNSTKVHSLSTVTPSNPPSTSFNTIVPIPHVSHSKASIRSQHSSIDTQTCHSSTLNQGQSLNDVTCAHQLSTYSRVIPPNTVTYVHHSSTQTNTQCASSPTGIKHLSTHTTTGAHSQSIISRDHHLTTLCSSQPQTVTPDYHTSALTSSIVADLCSSTPTNSQTQDSVPHTRHTIMSLNTQHSSTDNSIHQPSTLSSLPLNSVTCVLPLHHQSNTTLPNAITSVQLSNTVAYNQHVNSLTSSHVLGSTYGHPCSTSAMSSSTRSGLIPASSESHVYHTKLLPSTQSGSPPVSTRLMSTFAHSPYHPSTQPSSQNLCSTTNVCNPSILTSVQPSSSATHIHWPSSLIWTQPPSSSAHDSNIATSSFPYLTQSITVPTTQTSSQLQTSASPVTTHQNTLTTTASEAEAIRSILSKYPNNTFELFTPATVVRVNRRRDVPTYDSLIVIPSYRPRYNTLRIKRPTKSTDGKCSDSETGLHHSTNDKSKSLANSISHPSTSTESQSLTTVSLDNHSNIKTKSQYSNSVTQLHCATPLSTTQDTNTVQLSNIVTPISHSIALTGAQTPSVHISSAERVHHSSTRTRCKKSLSTSCTRAGMSTGTQPLSTTVHVCLPSTLTTAQASNASTHSVQSNPSSSKPNSTTYIHHNRMTSVQPLTTVANVQLSKSSSTSVHNPISLSIAQTSFSAAHNHCTNTLKSKSSRYATHTKASTKAQIQTSTNVCHSNTSTSTQSTYIYPQITKHPSTVTCDGLSNTLDISKAESSAFHVHHTGISNSMQPSSTITHDSYQGTSTICKPSSATRVCHQSSLSSTQPSSNVTHKCHTSTSTIFEPSKSATLVFCSSSITSSENSRTATYVSSAQANAQIVSYASHVPHPISSSGVQPLGSTSQSLSSVTYVHRPRTLCTSKPKSCATHVHHQNIPSSAQLSCIIPHQYHTMPSTSSKISTSAVHCLSTRPQSSATLQNPGAVKLVILADVFHFFHPRTQITASSTNSVTPTQSDNLGWETYSGNSRSSTDPFSTNTLISQICLTDAIRPCAPMDCAMQIWTKVGPYVSRMHSANYANAELFVRQYFTPQQVTAMKAHLSCFTAGDFSSSALIDTQCNSTSSEITSALITFVHCTSQICRNPTFSATYTGHLKSIPNFHTSSIVTDIHHLSTSNPASSSSHVYHQPISLTLPVRCPQPNHHQDTSGAQPPCSIAHHHSSTLSSSKPSTAAVIHCSSPQADARRQHCATLRPLGGVKLAVLVDVFHFVNPSTQISYNSANAVTPADNSVFVTKSCNLGWVTSDHPCASTDPFSTSVYVSPLPLAQIHLPGAILPCTPRDCATQILKAIGPQLCRMKSKYRAKAKLFVRQYFTPQQATAFKAYLLNSTADVSCSCTQTNASLQSFVSSQSPGAFVRFLYCTSPTWRTRNSAKHAHYSSILTDAGTGICDAYAGSHPSVPTNSHTSSAVTHVHHTSTLSDLNHASSNTVCNRPTSASIKVHQYKHISSIHIHHQNTCAKTPCTIAHDCHSNTSAGFKFLNSATIQPPSSATPQTQGSVIHVRNQGTLSSFQPPNKRTHFQDSQSLLKSQPSSKVVCVRHSRSPINIKSSSALTRIQHSSSLRVQPLSAITQVPHPNNQINFQSSSKNVHFHHSSDYTCTNHPSTRKTFQNPSKVTHIQCPSTTISAKSQRITTRDTGSSTLTRSQLQRAQLVSKFKSTQAHHQNPISSQFSSKITEIDCSSTSINSQRPSKAVHSHCPSSAISAKSLGISTHVRRSSNPTRSQLQKAQLVSKFKHARIHHLNPISSPFSSTVIQSDGTSAQSPRITTHVCCSSAPTSSQLQKGKVNFKGALIHHPNPISSQSASKVAHSSTEIIAKSPRIATYSHHSSTPTSSQLRKAKLVSNLKGARIHHPNPISPQTPSKVADIHCQNTPVSAQHSSNSITQVCHAHSHSNFQYVDKIAHIDHSCTASSSQNKAHPSSSIHSQQPTKKVASIDRPSTSILHTTSQPARKVARIARSKSLIIYQPSSKVALINCPNTPICSQPVHNVASIDHILPSTSILTSTSISPSVLILPSTSQLARKVPCIDRSRTLKGYGPPSKVVHIDHPHTPICSQPARTVASIDGLSTLILPSTQPVRKVARIDRSRTRLGFHPPSNAVYIDRPSTPICSQPVKKVASIDSPSTSICSQPVRKVARIDRSRILIGSQPPSKVSPVECPSTSSHLARKVANIDHPTTSVCSQPARKVARIDRSRIMVGSQPSSKVSIIDRPSTPISSQPARTVASINNPSTLIIPSTSQPARKVARIDRSRRWLGCLPLSNVTDIDCPSTPICSQPAKKMTSIDHASTLICSHPARKMVHIDRSRILTDSQTPSKVSHVECPSTPICSRPARKLPGIDRSSSKTCSQSARKVAHIDHSITSLGSHPTLEVASIDYPSTLIGSQSQSKTTCIDCPTTPISLQRSSKGAHITHQDTPSIPQLQNKVSHIHHRNAAVNVQPPCTQVRRSRSQMHAKSPNVVTHVPRSRSTSPKSQSLSAVSCSHHFKITSPKVQSSSVLSRSCHSKSTLLKPQSSCTGSRYHCSISASANAQTSSVVSNSRHRKNASTNVQTSNAISNFRHRKNASPLVQSSTTVLCSHHSRRTSYKSQSLSTDSCFPNLQCTPIKAQTSSTVSHHRKKNMPKVQSSIAKSCSHHFSALSKVQSSNTVSPSCHSKSILPKAQASITASRSNHSKSTSPKSQTSCTVSHFRRKKRASPRVQSSSTVSHSPHPKNTSSQVQSSKTVSHSAHPKNTSSKAQASSTISHSLRRKSTTPKVQSLSADSHSHHLKTTSLETQSSSKVSPYHSRYSKSTTPKVTSSSTVFCSHHSRSTLCKAPSSNTLSCSHHSKSTLPKAQCSRTLCNRQSSGPVTFSLLKALASGDSTSSSTKKYSQSLLDKVHRLRGLILGNSPHSSTQDHLQRRRIRKRRKVRTRTTISGSFPSASTFVQSDVLIKQLSPSSATDFLLLDTSIINYPLTSSTNDSNVLASGLFLNTDSSSCHHHTIHNSPICTVTPIFHSHCSRHANCPKNSTHVCHSTSYQQH